MLVFLYKKFKYKNSINKKLNNYLFDSLIFNFFLLIFLFHVTNIIVNL